MKQSGSSARSTATLVRATPPTRGRSLSSRPGSRPSALSHTSAARAGRPGRLSPRPGSRVLSQDQCVILVEWRQLLDVLDRITRRQKLLLFCVEHAPRLLHDVDAPGLDDQEKRPTRPEVSLTVLD